MKLPHKMFQGTDLWSALKIGVSVSEDGCFEGPTDESSFFYAGSRVLRKLIGDSGPELKPAQYMLSWTVDATPIDPSSRQGV
jgi:hypothetical protein